MASKRSNLDGFFLGLVKFILGVAIAFFVISLAGVATARYFLTQLSTLPERPVYDNDSSPAQSINDSAQTTEQTAATAEKPTEAPTPDASESDDTEVLYQVKVTYGDGLLVRTGAGADATTIDGIDYDEVVDVLEESDRWYRIRTSSGVEGWIKGQGNTQKL